jgi:hypothetical protein
MSDLPGYRQEADKIEAANRDERQHMAAAQAQMDHQRRIFDDIVHTVEPDPVTMHNTMLLNLTTNPPWKFRTLMLTWMQRSPSSWPGWYPEQCQKVAEMEGLGEAV